jgi:hypothetical protein
MSLNIAALKAKLGQFTRQNDRSEALWKPTEGKTVVRIVPWKENKENPFIELYFHYLGNKTLLSPTSYGNRDPIMEFAEALAAGGTKDDWAQARPFRPKLRTFVPIIVRGEEEKGVRFMSFGKTVYTELLSIISDPDYGDITDVKNGRDIVVEYIPQEKSDTNFAKTMVRPKPNQTALAESADKIQKLLTEQPDIRAIFKEPSYEELKVALERYLDPNAPSAPVARESAPEASTPAPTKSATAAKSAETTSKSTSVKDMIDEFDEVFN